MAEPTGLVIGGIARVALFAQCMSLFDHFDSGINCSDSIYVGGKASVQNADMFGGKNVFDD